MSNLYIMLAKKSLSLNAHVWTRENQSILIYKIIAQWLDRIFDGL